MLSQEADHVATQVRGSTALDSIIWLFNSCDALCQSMTYSTALTVEELKDLSIIPDTSAMNDDFCALVENLFGSWAWVSSTFGRCDFLCFHKSQGKLPSAGAVRDAGADRRRAFPRMRLSSPIAKAGTITSCISFCN